MTGWRGRWGGEGSVRATPHLPHSFTNTEILQLRLKQQLPNPPPPAIRTQNSPSQTTQTNKPSSHLTQTQRLLFAKIKFWRPLHHHPFSHIPTQPSGLTYHQLVSHTPMALLRVSAHLHHIGVKLKRCLLFSHIPYFLFFSEGNIRLNIQSINLSIHPSLNGLYSIRMPVTLGWKSQFYITMQKKRNVNFRTILQ